MNRRKAREYVFQLIFGYEFTKEKDEETFGMMMRDTDLSDEDRQYIADTFDNVVIHYDELKETVAKYAIGFQVDRIFKPDLAVMLLAICEMKYNDNVPMGVAIAEAVAIIKRYSTTKSGSFVNGLLASVYKELNI